MLSNKIKATFFVAILTSVVACGAKHHATQGDGHTSSIVRSVRPHVEGGTGQSYIIHTGKRGGQYYINSNGNKVYLKKGGSRSGIYKTKSTRSRGGSKYRSYRRR